MFLLALGLAGFTELLITVEWSFPYCNDQQDGPASAVYGFPFPYLQWGGVSSLEFEFVPQLYALNLALQTALVFFLVRTVARRMWPTKERLPMAAVGLLFCAGFLLIKLLLISSGVRHPRASLTDGTWDSYTELRPVGLAASLEYYCTPY